MIQYEREPRRIPPSAIEQQNLFRIASDDWSKPTPVAIDFSTDRKVWHERCRALLEEDDALPGTAYIALYGFYPNGGWLRLRVGG